MTADVAIPLWSFVALAVLAAWAAYDKLLVPALSWFVAGRANSVLDEVSTRLRIGVRPFQRTRRQVLIHRLLGDPKVQAAVEQFAAQHKIPVPVALATVERHAREIVPAFNAYLYFRIGYWAAKRVAHFLYRVRLGYADSAALAAVNPQSAVVFVINHRSNMDYVLVAFLAAERVALSYAVGEWARVWPLQTLIRAMGAYFVRRNSGDPLYRTVLQRYVQMATEAGVPQAVYPEGGLSVDGRLRAPRLGLLDYMLKTFNPDGARDLVFIPVGVNYDRVLEDRTLLLKSDAARPRHGFIHAVAVALAFAGRQLRNMVFGRWYRFGYACVNFGRPISMRDYVRQHGFDFRALDDAQRHERVAALGAALMNAIGQITPVLPVALVATVLLSHPENAMSELDLKAAIHALIAKLEHGGAHIYIPRADHDYAITVGLRMLTLRRVVTERDGLYAVARGQLDLLRYYANSIAHLVERADGVGPQ